MYRCRDRDGNPAAIKVYKQRIDELSSFELSLLQNEIEALTRLRHPSLVEVRGHGVVPEGHPYLVMELVEGVRLDEYLADHHRLDAVEALQLGRKIADALAYIHDRGLLHLDLKPANIMLLDPHEPSLKLLDFGLATVVGIHDPSRQLHRPGTPAYMAPELFAAGGPAPPDERMDIYALGVILYQMMAGENPFRVHEPAWRKRFYDIAPLRERAPSAPHAVAALIHRLIARDPDVRPSRADAVSAELRRLYFQALRGGDAARRPGESRFVTARTAPLVGRRAELAAVGERVRAARSGRGGAVVIAGAVGIGKSRLVAEVLAPLERARDVLLGYGRCRQLGNLVPLSPLREALAQLPAVMAQRRGDGLTDLRARLGEVLASEGDVLLELVPELREVVGARRGASSPPDPLSDPLSERASGRPDLASSRLVGADRVAHAVRRLLRTFGVSAPVVLAIEDIHWADEGTLGVLARLIPRLGEASVTLLCTTRLVANGEAPARPWRQLLGDDAVEAATVIELGPLDEGESAELVRALGATADPALVAELMRSVPLLRAGNPLCTSRVIYNLELEGYLARGRDGALIQRRPIAHDYEPPDSVSLVLQRTLAHLDASAVDVLGVAALFGRQFDRAAVIALEIAGAADVDRALAQAERHGLCHVAGDLCTFVHDTIKEELERQVAAERLPELHRRIARQLAASDAPPGALAHHLEAAGERLAAADAYVRAGLRADQMRDCASAGAFFQRAARLLVGLPGGPHRDDLVAVTAHELARVAALAGDTGDVIDTLDRCAGALGDAAAAHKLAVDAAYARAHYARGDFAAAVEASRACLAVDVDAPELRRYHCAPANIVGRALSATGKFGPSVPVLERGCELAREAGDFVELSHSEGLLGVSLGFVGGHARAREHVAAASELADRLGDPIRVMGAFFYRAALAETTGDWEAGAADSTQLIHWAEEHALSGLYLYLGTMFAGRHYYHLGNLKRARILLLNALNLARALGIRIGVAWACAFLGDVYFAGGALDRARAAYTEGATHGNAAATDEYGGPMCQLGLAHLAAIDGGEDAARALFAEALARLDAVSNRCTQIAGLQRQAEALDLFGDGDGARASRARREGLIRDVGCRRPEFWPRVPAEPGGDAPDEPRRFWQAQRERGLTREALGYDATTPARREPGAGEADGVTASEPGLGGVGSATRVSVRTLFDTLSTIEGYVPMFHRE